MLGRTGRSGQQGIASLRLAIKQAPSSTHAGRMENAIVDDLDVLDRMADLSSPPAAAEATGLQKPAHFRRRSGTRVDRRRTTALRHHSSALLVRHLPDEVGREVFVCLSLSLRSYGCSRAAITANDCVICEKGKERGTNADVAEGGRREYQ